MRWWNRIRRSKAGNIAIVFFSVQIICIIASLWFPDDFRYLSLQNIQILLKSIPPLAILSIGVGMLMIAGEFDLSVGSNFALSSFVMAWAFNAGLPAPLALALALSTGATIGLLNGIIVLKARIPSFIATLGAMMFWRGIILVTSEGTTAPFRPGDFFKSFFTGSLGPFQAQFFWLVVVAVAAFLLLERHRFGNHVFAVGGDIDAAFAIGVNPQRVKIVCFVVVGALAALTGALSTIRVGSVSPVQGQGMELKAIAACVVGGASLVGGSGTILGVVLGSALLFTIEDILLLLRAPGEYLDMFVGILIIAAVILNNLTKKK